MRLFGLSMIATGVAIYPTPITLGVFFATLAAHLALEKFLKDQEQKA